MPYIIKVECAHSTIAEDAAALTAFNTLMTSLRAATTKKIDAGGTIIAGKLQTGDEASGSHLQQGTIW